MQTELSALSYLMGLLSLSVCLFSFWGWGILICRVLRTKVNFYIIDIAIGSAGTIFILSVFSLFSLISVNVLAAVLIVGVFSFAFNAKDALHTFNFDKFQLLAMTSALLGVGIPLIFPFYNRHDDFHAYINLPLITTATGGLNYLSFMERGLYSLGGQVHLQSLYLVIAPLFRINLFDTLFFHLLSVLLFYKYSLKPLQLNLFIKCIVIIVIAGAWPMVANVSSYGTSELMFLAIFYLAIEGLAAKKVTSMILAFGFLGGALVSLKLTMLVFFSLGTFLFILKNGLKSDLTKIKKFKFAICSVALGLLFLLPAMLESYGNFHTVMFPLLGKGNHLSNITDYPISFWDHKDPSVSWVMNELLRPPTMRVAVIFYILLFLSKFNVARMNRFYNFYDKVTLAKFDSIVWMFPIAYSIYFWNMMLETPRYAHPVFLWLFGLFFAIILDFFWSIKTKFNSKGLKIGLIGVVCFYVLKDNFLINYNVIRSARSNSMSFYNFHKFEEIKTRYIEFQKHIPVGKKVFTFAAYPFFLDFKRNKFYLCDWGGSVSIDGTMPHFGTSTALRVYLKAKGIDYIMYSHRNSANFGVEFTNYLKHPYLQLREYARYNFDLISKFDEIIANKQYAYIDNENVLIPTDVDN